jgi:hypothetical protein
MPTIAYCCLGVAISLQAQAIFLEPRTREVRRITLPRTPVDTQTDQQALRTLHTSDHFSLAEVSERR